MRHRLFGPVQEGSADRHLHSNEVEMAWREWLQKY